MAKSTKHGIAEKDVPESWRYLLEYVPNLAYWKVHSDYRDPSNFVGHIQRGFILYWAIRGAKDGGIGVDMGCGSVPSPFCLGIDKYGRDEKDSYGGQCKPHIVLRADKPLPFESDSFDFLVANHALEHMVDTLWTLKEWIRIVKPGGILAIVMPDAKYGPVMDEDHKAEYTAEQFKEEVLSQVEDVDIVEFDTFKNNFSMNCVLRKKK